MQTIQSDMITLLQASQWQHDLTKQEGMTLSKSMLWGDAC